MVYKPFVIKHPYDARDLPLYTIDTSEMLVVFSTGYGNNSDGFQADFFGGK